MIISNPLLFKARSRPLVSVYLQAGFTIPLLMTT